MGRRRPRSTTTSTGAAGASLLAIAFFLLAAVAASAYASASFISEVALGSHGSSGRSLLQAKQSCQVNFEFMNYTVITSQCRGPQYSTRLCCGAFKEFACPYAEQLNDLDSDCGSTMFSYINLYGNYPAGLFSSLCRDSRRGLECTAEQRKTVDVPTAATMAHGVPPLAIMLWFLLTFLLF